MYNLSTDTSDIFRVPDYRECALVGIGHNTTDTIVAHDVYTLGQFKDDRMQRIYGEFGRTIWSTNEANNGPFTKSSTGKYGGGSENVSGSECRWVFDSSLVTRTGSTTHGKQKGVNYIIKY